MSGHHESEHYRDWHGLHRLKITCGFLGGWAAECSCGWEGDHHSRYQTAMEDATTHLEAQE